MNRTRSVPVGQDPLIGVPRPHGPVKRDGKAPDPPEPDPNPPRDPVTEVKLDFLLQALENVEVTYFQIDLAKLDPTRRNDLMTMIHVIRTYGDILRNNV